MVGREAQYESFASEFAEHAATGAYNAYYDRPAVLAVLGDVAGARVLDAPCGPGLYAEALVERGARVVGFDQSAGMVALARERLAGRAEFRQHDLADALDWLSESSFDVALLALALEYVDDRVSALRELHRVLTPEGVLVVSEQHPTADWLRRGGSYFDVELVAETWSKGWELRYWQQPLERTCEDFAAAGFVIDRLLEPRPTPEMADVYPEQFRELEHGPGFIIFRLTKRDLASGRRTR